MIYMNRQKCIVYLVNGINIPMFNLEQRGQAYIGYTSWDGKKRRTFTSSEINAIEGRYDQIELIRQVNTRDIKYNRY